MPLKTFDAGTPFNFETQALLYIPALPDPKKAQDAWRARSLLETRALMEAAGGRTLSLYTSRRELDEAYDSLSSFLEDTLGVNVFQQVAGASNKALTQGFSNDETSVLFGLKSFFTGIDVQGPSLSCLNINKLPFAVPTDVMYKSRCDAWDRQHRSRPFDRNGSFFQIAIPEMALTLLQGLGRGIRTVNDYCLLSILDPRLLTTGYGKMILTAILKYMPGLTFTSDRSEATAFLKTHVKVAA